MAQATLNTGRQGCALETDAGSELLNAGAGVLGGDDFVTVVELGATEDI